MSPKRLVDCDRCKEFSFLEEGLDCDCIEYECKCHDYGREESVWAKSEEKAASKFTELIDEKWDLVNYQDESIKISVNGTEYLVSARTEVHYDARKL